MACFMYKRLGKTVVIVIKNKLLRSPPFQKERGVFYSQKQFTSYQEKKSLKKKPFFGNNLYRFRREKQFLISKEFSLEIALTSFFKRKREEKKGAFF